MNEDLTKLIADLKEASRCKTCRGKRVYKKTHPAWRARAALTQQHADLKEFAKRLGPRWFLEQDWFPESLNGERITNEEQSQDTV